MSNVDRSPAELSSWQEVNRGLSDLAVALGTSNSPRASTSVRPVGARSAELNAAMDQAGWPSLDELARMGEWSS